MFIGGPITRAGAMTSGQDPGSWLAHAAPRPGQAEMMGQAAQMLAQGGTHVAAAPTGIGKTAAALAAAVMAARASVEPRTVMFLTGRQGQHHIAVETVRAMNAGRPPDEPPLKLVDLIGQQGMCVRPEVAGTHPARFSRLCADERRGRRCRPFLQEAEDLVERILRERLHVGELVGLAESWPPPVCAWRVAREAAAHADVIVCDYNHIFHDAVRESSLPAMQLELGQLLLIVDEAHNLPDRIRMGMQRTLSADLLRDAADEVEEHVGTLRQALKATAGQLIADPAMARKAALADELAWAHDILGRWRQRFIGWRNELVRAINTGAHEVTERGRQRECAIEASTLIGQLDGVIKETLGEARPLRRLVRMLERVEVEDDPGAPPSDDETAAARLGQLVGQLDRFRASSALACVFSLTTDDVARITTHLLDPGEVAGPLFDEVAGSLLMSGTLHPPEMYADLLRLPRQRGRTLRTYASPFLDQRRPVALATDVSTAYKDRGPGMTERLRAHIRSLVEATPGHVAAFCPSYKLQEDIIEEGRWHGVQLVAESSDWSKAEVDAVLPRLEGARRVGQRILLAGVFGGRLAEGIDYQGNVLDAVVCVGIPNAPPSVQNDALKAYLSEHFGADRAWRYAVLQPAVNSVLQGMGRPIRSTADRAFVLLLDHRLAGPRYRQCLPDHLRPLSVDDPAATKRLASRFFRTVPPADARAAPA